ncbi:MAG: hypothetical protein IT449_01400 [Phycisphaerales bacterium]|nr:hypothetical protein [Phycisphaerales bacterium]
MVWSNAGILLGFVILTTYSAPRASAQDDCGWQLQDDGSSPSPRSNHAMAFDSGRGVIVLFGGGDENGLFGDTWEWNGTTTTWELRATTGPSPRFMHALAYDSDRSRTVLFGGSDSQGLNRETWEWNGTTTTWELRATTGPSPRYDHAMAYDSTRGVTVLFGGRDNEYGGEGELDGQTWEWDGELWTQRCVGCEPGVSSPSPRRGHRMAYDSARGVTVMFGAETGSERDTQTWEWDGAVWTPQSPDPSPSLRFRFGLAYDSDRNVTVLFGGSDYDNYNGYKDDTWEWNGNVWTPQSPDPTPSARRNVSMAYDSTNHVSVLFGGYDGTRHYGDTLEYSCGAICNNVVGLKAKCKYGRGRFKVRAKVITQLPEGTVLTLCLDLNECDLNGNEACQPVSIGPRGTSLAKWTTFEKGDPCVCVQECPDLCRTAPCSPWP